MEYYSLKEDELIGKQFGDLKVLDVAYENKELNYKKYLCECKCGKPLVVEENDLVIGYVDNCGCRYETEYIKVNCSHCGKITIFPLEKNNFKKDILQYYKDSKGKQHYKIIYSVNGISSSIKVLQQFIGNNCMTLEYISPKQRTLRSVFRQEYIKWLENNDYLDFKLNNKELNKQLKEIYDETYIKSNGNVYMKKIKLVNSNLHN